LKKYNTRVWIGFMWLMIGGSGVLCEPSSSIKFGGFLEPLCAISFLRRTLGNGDIKPVKSRG
jgi:hypothetical protein